MIPSTQGSRVPTLAGKFCNKWMTHVLGDVLPVLDSLIFKAFEAGEPGDGGAEAGAMRACVFRDLLPHAPMSVF